MRDFVLYFMYGVMVISPYVLGWTAADRRVTLTWRKRQKAISHDGNALLKWREDRKFVIPDHWKWHYVRGLTIMLLIILALTHDLLWPWGERWIEWKRHS